MSSIIITNLITFTITQLKPWFLLRAYAEWNFECASEFQMYIYSKGEAAYVKFKYNDLQQTIRIDRKIYFDWTSILIYYWI